MWDESEWATLPFSLLYHSCIASKIGFSPSLHRVHVMQNTVIHFWLYSLLICIACIKHRNREGYEVNSCMTGTVRSYLMGFLLSSGSFALTMPTRAPALASSCTSMMVPSAGWKVGGSSMSETLTRTMVWSRKEPRSTKRGSTCLLMASTTTLCVRLLSKSSGWNEKKKGKTKKQKERKRH